MVEPIQSYGSFTNYMAEQGEFGVLHLITNSVEKTISSKYVTYDFARLMDGATEVKCSEFATRLIENF